MSTPKLIGGHYETIKCPECGKVQQAAVEHTKPWWTYIHHCECGHIITESEWEETLSQSARRDTAKEQLA